jgi:hypothetical protein
MGKIGQGGLSLEFLGLSDDGLGTQSRVPIQVDYFCKGGELSFLEF